MRNIQHLAGINFMNECSGDGWVGQSIGQDVYAAGDRLVTGTSEGGGRMNDHRMSPMWALFQRLHLCTSNSHPRFGPVILRIDQQNL